MNRIRAVGTAILASFLVVAASWAGDKEGQAGGERAFLGVYVEGVSSVVSSQLGLDEGVGVVVEGVIPDSPAEKAELKKNDILLKFDDQILIGTKQIVILVRNSAIGSEHTITLLRGGKEQTLAVTIEGKQAPTGKDREEHGQFFNVPVHPAVPAPPMPPNPRIMAMRALVDAENLDTDVLFWSSGEETDLIRKMEMNEEMEQLMQRVNSLSGQEGVAPMPQFFFHEDHVFEFVDDSGKQYMIVEKNGERSLTIVDEDGEEVYAGALDGDALKALPESVKSNLPKIQKAVKVRVEAPAWSAKRSDEVF